jgi:hypothetical protein
LPGGASRRDVPGAAAAFAFHRVARSIHFGDDQELLVNSIGHGSGDVRRGLPDRIVASFSGSLGGLGAVCFLFSFCVIAARAVENEQRREPADRRNCPDKGHDRATMRAGRRHWLLVDHLPI